MLIFFENWVFRFPIIVAVVIVFTIIFFQTLLKLDLSFSNSYDWFYNFYILNFPRKNINKVTRNQSHAKSSYNKQYTLRLPIRSASGSRKHQSGYSPFVMFSSTTLFRLLELFHNSFIATKKTSHTSQVKCHLPKNILINS